MVLAIWSQKSHLEQVRKGTPDFPVLEYDAVLVFSLLFHAHFSYLNSSLMSPTFPFSVHMWVFTHAYHFKDKFLNLQGMGPNGSSILVKLIYHQDQSNSLLQDIFLGGFPGTCFSSLVSGEADPVLFLWYLVFLIAVVLSMV